MEHLISLNDHCSKMDQAYTALCSAATLISNKNGFFQQVTNSVIAATDHKWISDFGKLKSNEERIKKCLLKGHQVECQVRQMMDNVQEVFRAKSSRMSLSKKLDADHLYKTGKLDNALAMYNQSITRAPSAGVDQTVDDGLGLALALWGRSKVLFELGKMNFCLEDVKFCLKEKLPDYLKTDAYWRMAECYIHLKQFNHARITLKILSKLTQQLDSFKESEEWRERIQSKFDGLESLVRNGFSDVIKKSDTAHQHISSKLKLSRSDPEGNFWIAADHIQTGEALLVEEPYVSCLLTEKYGSHCLHCLRRLEVAVPCSGCSAVAFCGLSCRTKSLSSYHRFECHYLDLLIGSGMSILCHAALRIVTQSNTKYFVAADSESRNTKLYDYMQVYHLETHADERTALDFLNRTLMALFLWAVLKKSGFFLDSKSVDDIGPQDVSIICVLLRNLEVLQFNAHEISEAVKSKSTNSIRTFNIGIGLYKNASYFNHGCFPAVCRYFDGNKLIMKSVRPISSGEVVEDNYGPIFTIINREERRRNLLSRYWFLCECKACVENWPMLTGLSKTTFRRRCSFCNIPCSVDDQTPITQCDNCTKHVDCASALQQMKFLDDQYKKNIQELDENIIFEICKILDVLNTVLCPPHKIYADVGHKLSQYWMNTYHIFTA